MRGWWQAWWRQASESESEASLQRLANAERCRRRGSRGRRVPRSRSARMRASDLASLVRKVEGSRSLDMIVKPGLRRLIEKNILKQPVCTTGPSAGEHSETKRESVREQAVVRDLR